MSIRNMQKQAGLTMVELMVALAIGSFLIIGAVQIYNQSRQAFTINESIARVQETAQFAMDTIEADLRMASNWGRNSRPLSVTGRSLSAAAAGGTADPNPMNLPAPPDCGADWSLNLAATVDGSNNTYDLLCGANGGAGPQPNSDIITIRRASVNPVPPLAGALQIQTTRLNGELFADGNVPAEFSTAINPNTGEPYSTTHNLIINSYYVAADSDLIPGVPALRRKSLGVGLAGPVVVDQEIAPGVENIQIQLGVDIDEDNTVDRYVNPGDGVYDPDDAAYVPGARVLTARFWIVVRGLNVEVGVQDVRDYEPGDVDLGVPNDQFRRMQVSKTVLMRNARI
ncbi:MAG: PilW family protein [Woeseiaceae bacterium]|jgi:type IV pilus assembly protein PilW